MNGITVDKDALLSKYSEIQTLDEKIDAASGTSASGKRAIANRLMQDASEKVNPVTAELSEYLSKIDDELVIVGVVRAIEKFLNENFGDKVDEILSREVESRKAEIPQVSPDELNALQEERKTLLKQFNALKNILESFEVDVSDVPTPKTRVGVRGPRGSRAFGKYNYFIDGKPRTESQNNLSSIANTVAPEEWKTADLRNFLKENGITKDTLTPEWEVTLPNGKVLKAVLKEGQTLESSDVEDEDDEDDDDNEE